MAGNFKSIAEQVSIDLKPLTLLCGANSSGKSSFIQALTLLTQSATGQPTTSSIQLNGPLVELGTLDEVSFRGRKAPVSFGVGIRTDRRSLLPHGATRIGPGFASDFLEANLEVAVEAVEGRLGVPRTVRIEFAATAGLTASIEVDRRRGGRRPINGLPIEVSRTSTLSNLEYRISLESDEAPLNVGTTFGYLSSSDAPPRLPIGLQMTGPIPQSRWASYSPVARQVDRVVRSALRLPSSSRAALEQLEGSDGWSVFLQWWSTPDVVEILGEQPGSAAAAYDKIRGTKPMDRPLLRANLTTFLGKFESFPGGKVAYERLPLPFPLDAASDAMISELRDVRHLGPLRAEPRPFYSLPTSGDPLSVGPSGEFTAAVLTRLADSSVVFAWDGERITEPLGAAVNRWLAFLGVHSEARALELGKFGHFVGVSDASLTRYMDLTQVGVGVSQVLPVIVQGLVAPEGSTLLFEQPELHLHPAVQSRLAVFLSALATTGRLVVCETHSEYLVTRVRLLVADQRLAYGSDVAVYFTSRLDGRTDVLEVALGEHGELSAWPDGFFDQGVADASAILERQLRP